jgi:hypothetical protein
VFDHSWFFGIDPFECVFFGKSTRFANPTWLENPNLTILLRTPERRSGCAYQTEAKGTNGAKGHGDRRKPGSLGNSSPKRLKITPI